MADDFVKGILDDSSPGETDRHHALVRDESMRTIRGQEEAAVTASTPPTKERDAAAFVQMSSGSPKSDYGSLEFAAATPAAAAGVARGPADEAADKAQSMFRYSLIFINFTFVVASMLLTMAGIVARENSAVKLCRHCGELTMVSIVFGGMLWLFAMFGFNWIRQKNMLFLLVYVAFLLLFLLVLSGVVIAAGVFDADLRSERGTSSTNFLGQWELAVLVNETDSGYSAVCALQKQFNCSGFVYGCCYFNETDPTNNCYNLTANGTAPPWVSRVCPICPGKSAPQVCTDIVFSTLQKNLGGFLVISCFSMALVLLGVLLAVLSRKIVQS